MSGLVLLSFVAAAAAQQVYIPTSGPPPRPWCGSTSQYPTGTPTFAYSQFAYTNTETVRTAVSVTPGPTTTYAAPYESLKHLGPNVSTTTWGNWNPDDAKATDTADPHGQAAWSSIWESAALPNFTFRGLYSTTVSPTPVPTSELVYPPPEYFLPQDCYNFPEGFIFGVAASAGQIEGAIADEGRTPSGLDAPGGMINGDSTGYVGNENYYLYKQDIERLASIGVKYYSFSISWNRILPFALPGTPVNAQGLQHYADLIDFVYEKGMIPVVTLLHFDVPLQFNPAFDQQYDNSSFQDAFVNYAQIVMTRFADRVPIWITFNEPALGARSAVGVSNVVWSHARVWHFYHDVLNGTGLVSYKNNNNFGIPRDPSSADDVAAADHYNDLQIASFGNPIFLGEDWPGALRQTYPDYVPLTAEDLAYLNGTADFLATDYYVGSVISGTPESLAACIADYDNDGNAPYCVDQAVNTTTGWDIGYRSQSYVYQTPQFLRTYLNYLWNRFRPAGGIMLTEFGFPEFHEGEKATLGDQVFDSVRSQYYTAHLTEVLRAIWDDHVDVRGALAWSWADNWEFGDFGQQFGLQIVNRTTQERSFKKSFFDLLDFVATRMPSENGTTA